MAQQLIDLGTVANDGTGDNLREGGEKINENFTELYALDDHFKGVYATDAALTSAHPAAAEGDYAYVDAGLGNPVELWIWDEDDTEWIQSGTGGTVTSVAGTTNRITSSGGVTPTINIDAAYDAAVLAAAVAALPNGLPAVDTTGTAIQFDVPKTYGSVATPETGNITLNSTGFVKGMVQVLLHNHSSIPTFGSEFKKIGGAYIVGVKNSIYMHSISTTLIEYTVSQEG